MVRRRKFPSLLHVVRKSLPDQKTFQQSGRLVIIQIEKEDGSLFSFLFKLNFRVAIDLKEKWEVCSHPPSVSQKCSIATLHLPDCRVLSTFNFIFEQNLHDSIEKSLKTLTQKNLFLFMKSSSALKSWKVHFTREIVKSFTCFVDTSIEFCSNKFSSFLQVADF